MRKTLHWILNFTNFLKNISFLPWWWLPFSHQLIHMLQWVRVRIYKLRRLHDGRSAEFKSEVTALFVFLYLCICMFLYFCICVFVYVQYVKLCICQSVLSAELQSGVTGGRRWMDRPSSADRSSIHSLLPCPPSPSLSLSLWSSPPVTHSVIAQSVIEGEDEDDDDDDFQHDEVGMMTSQMTKTKSPPYVSLGPCHGPMTMIFLSVSITVPMHQMHSVHVCFGVCGDYMVDHHTQLVFIATILFPIALLPHVASLIYLFTTI